MQALITAWERGQRLGPVERGLILLQLASPALADAQCAAVPIGERDRRLLALRASLFGERLVGLVACPQCGERLELEATTAELTCPPADVDLRLARRGYELDLRLPDSTDLRASSVATTDPAAAARALIARCIVSARRGDTAVDAGELPAAVLEDAAERIAAADPQADVQLALSCAACAAPCRAPFDIVSFMWTELEALAERLLWEVHTLAQAYGWSEPEVLALGPARREAYLRMVLA